MQFKHFIAVVFATIAALAPVEVIARPGPNENPEFTPEFIPGEITYTTPDNTEVL